MEDKEAIWNLTNIQITLSHSLTQAQEIVFVLSKQLHALQTQEKANTPTTERPVLDKKTNET